MTPSSTRKRSRLLPSLSLLALIDLVLLNLPRWPIILALGFLGAVLYLACLVLSTKDIAADFENQHPIDRFLCRWSGPIAVLTFLGLIIAVAQTDLKREPEETWIGSSWGLMSIKFTMELGFILSVACWCKPTGSGHNSNLGWRILVVPLLVIYGMYLVLLPIGQLAGDCDKNDPNEVPVTFLGAELSGIFVSG